MAVATGYYHTVGLRSDGTVVTAGDNKDDLSGWTDIVAVDANYHYTVGLRPNGTTVVATERNMNIHR